MKNKYCPMNHRSDTDLANYCPYCECLNRQQEDIITEIAAISSFSKGQGQRGEEAFRMLERDLDRLVYSLKGGDKLKVDKEV